MSLNYAGRINFDLGEQRHIRVKVQAECGTDEDFTIRNAQYELITGEETEDSGVCAVAGHRLDAHICPKKRGNYDLKFTYEIADETWIDVIRIKVE